MVTRLRFTCFAGLAVIATATLSGVSAEDEGKNRPTFTENALNEGDRVPNFNAPDHKGKLWVSAVNLPMNCTIVWFYKGDFLPRSIKQAKRFRDKGPLLREHGVQVIGISGDSVKNHCQFNITYNLKFTLLADPEGEVAELFGVTFTEGGKARLRDGEGRVIIDPEKGKSIILSRGVTLSPSIIIIGRTGKIIYKQPSCETKKDVDAAVKFLRDRNWQ
jgi:peroxiredoxin Q/BCP